MHDSSLTRVCFACYLDRLATVFENADEYRIFEIRDDIIYPAGLLSLPSKDPMDRTSAILACGVSFLVCGAICADSRTLLESNGVTVFPWITGKADKALGAFCSSTLETMTMPGCREWNAIDTTPFRSKRTGLHIKGRKPKTRPDDSAI